MLKIYITRHGQDEDNKRGILNGRRDFPLTDKGVQQAMSLAKMIRDANIVFDKIYFSPLKRTRQTAQIIAKETNCKSFDVLNELIERDFGILTGKTHDDISIYCSEYLFAAITGFNYMLEAKDLESFPKTLLRAKKVLRKIKSKHKKGNVLLVTHGDVGKMVYAAYYKLDWKVVLKQFHFGNSDLLLLSTDSPAQKSHVFKGKQFNL